MKIRILGYAGAATLWCTVVLAQPRPPPGGPHHPPPPPPERGAHIRVRQGDNAVDVACPGDTSLRDCSETAMRFFDRVIGTSPAKPPEPAAPR